MRMMMMMIMSLVEIVLSQWVVACQVYISQVRRVITATETENECMQCVTKLGYLVLPLMYAYSTSAADVNATVVQCILGCAILNTASTNRTMYPEADTY